MVEVVVPPAGNFMQISWWKKSKDKCRSTWQKIDYSSMFDRSRSSAVFIVAKTKQYSQLSLTMLNDFPSFDFTLLAHSCSMFFAIWVVKRCWTASRPVVLFLRLRIFFLFILVFETFPLLTVDFFLMFAGSWTLFFGFPWGIFEWIWNERRNAENSDWCASRFICPRKKIA